MLSKQTAYLLFGIISLFTILFGVNIYLNNQKNKNTEDKINIIINKFEEKFKADSTYLARANKMLIDKISQKIIDSVSSVYEEKLVVALEQSQNYKSLLIANNIAIKETKRKTLPVSKKKKTNRDQIKSNKKRARTSYREIANNVQKETTTSNVTTYTQLNKTENATTYALLNKTANVTTHSQKKNRNSKVVTNIQKETQPNSLKNYASNTSSKVHNTFKISHNNKLLDNAENINEIEQSPLYPGCGIFLSNSQKRKCFATKISKHILNNFKSSNAKNNTVPKDLNKVRVLFVIDKNGNTKFGKLVGKWPDKVYREAKKAVESTPTMKPGRNRGSNISVKYSLLIPFIN